MRNIESERKTDFQTPRKGNGSGDKAFLNRCTEYKVKLRGESPYDKESISRVCIVKYFKSMKITGKEYTKWLQDSYLIRMIFLGKLEEALWRYGF